MLSRSSAVCLVVAVSSRRIVALLVEGATHLDGI